MMLTIDTGTTNTRVCLWDAGGHPMAAASSGTGVRDTAVDGNNSRLREAVRGCLAGFLLKNWKASMPRG